MKKIIINGKEYNSIEEVPGMLRDLLKDENKDGMPDIAEKAIKEGFQSSNTISVNGQSLQNLSPEEKAKITQMIQKNQKFLQNPMLGALIKGVSGFDPNEIVNKINSNLNQPASKKSSLRQIRSTTAPKSLIQKRLAHYQPPSSLQPGIKKDSGRNFLVFAAIIGFIGWLLYTYTDII
jgi:hypothetical protein